MVTGGVSSAEGRLGKASGSLSSLWVRREQHGPEAGGEGARDGLRELGRECGVIQSSQKPLESFAQGRKATWLAVMGL